VFLGFAVATFFVQLQNGIINSLAVFAFSVGLELPTKILWSIFVLYIATLVALPLTLYWAGRAEKHHLLAVGTAINAIAVAALIWVPMNDFPKVAALWVLAGLGNAGMFFLPTSMLADIIDRAEVASGERRSGAYVALYNLVFKIGLAVGVGAAFGLLEIVHFDPAASRHSAADAQNIRLLAFGLPSLLLLPAILLYLKYPITKRVHERLRSEIAARADLAPLSDSSQSA
jgi:GPH family glycoside/pentoside/hexuronide:cation symporter